MQKILFLLDFEKMYKLLLLLSVLQFGKYWNKII